MKKSILFVLKSILFTPAFILTGILTVFQVMWTLTFDLAWSLSSLNCRHFIKALNRKLKS